MTRLFTLIFIILCHNLYGQPKVSKTIAQPGQGIVIGSDTFKLGMTLNAVLFKLDTINNKVHLFYYNSKRETIGSVDSFGMTKNCYLVYNHGLVFKFSGLKGDSLSLDNIKLQYPLVAMTTTGERIGGKRKSIFKRYLSKTGSYNCGDKGFFICYPDKGISFEIKPYKLNPNIKMYDKIIGFDIYKSRQE